MKQAKLELTYSTMSAINRVRPTLGTLGCVHNSGAIKSILLHVDVREFPTEDVNLRKVSLRSLENVHIIITRPLLVNPGNNGYHSCVIKDLRASQWNNDNGLWQRLGTVDSASDITIIEFTASAKNGRWSGLLILRDRGSTYEQWITGELLTDGGETVKMSVHENHNGRTRQVRDGVRWKHITEQTLVDYGVPIRPISADELNAICTNRQFRKSFSRGATGVTMDFFPQRTGR
jgi:hypothetical protein